MEFTKLFEFSDYTIRALNINNFTRALPYNLFFNSNINNILKV